MRTSTGNSLPKPSSKHTEGLTRSLIIAFAICVVFGIALAICDMHLRLPLHLPGWRGVIGMALIVLARQLSGQVWGATCCALAAAVAGAYGADGMKFGPFAYLICGLVVDLLLARPAWRDRALLVGVAAGLANLSKFAVLLLATIILGSRLSGHGLVAPALGHFVFGVLGGLLVARVRRREANAPETGASKS